MGPLNALRGLGFKSKSDGQDSYDQRQRSLEKHGLFGQNAHKSDPKGLASQSLVAQNQSALAPIPYEGPPPSHTSETYENLPPYHDWTVIPDTALLPPPPAIHYEFSTYNASGHDANRAYVWCNQNPLYSPSKPDPSIYNTVQEGEISLQKPREFKGNLVRLGKGRWNSKTKSTCADCLLLTVLPLYFAAEDFPLLTGRRKTIYFELKLIALEPIRDSEAAGIGIGFCAKPYPSWRLPGWHRSSLAIHSDDGRRFVNDSDGGCDFTRPFAPGETVGVGMTFDVATDTHADRNIRAEVFFTRDGQRDGGWQVHEERDVETNNVAGLDGQLDLYAAIGIFGAVDFEVQLAPQNWLYQPY